jgi:hypothetical protein
MKSESLSFTSTGSGGVLHITDGALHATVTLFGQYVAAGFKLAADATGGTNLTYVGSGSPLVLAPAHHG